MARIPKNRRNEDYWANRDEAEAAWIAQNLANDEQFNARIQSYYDEAIANINREIESNYESLAKRGIGREAVSQMDVEAYQSEAAKIVRQAAEMRKAGHKVTYSDFSDEVNTRLRVYNATMRINRLEYLKSQVGLEMVRSGMKVDSAMREKLTDDYISEVKRQVGILGVSAQPSMWTNKEVAKVVMAQTNSSTFSKRIWANQDVLKARLDEVITSGIVRGDSPRKMATRLREQVRSTVKNQGYVTERIARTESARVQFKAQMNQISKNGYRFVKWFAEPKACAECSRIYHADNGYGEGVYKISKVPQIPVHPNCRCSISPTWVKDKDNLDVDKRRKHLEAISALGQALTNSSIGGTNNSNGKPVSNQSGQEDSELVDKYLNPNIVEKLGNITAERVAQRLDNAPTSIQKMWIKYSDGMKIKDISEDGANQYSPRDKTVVMSRANIYGRGDNGRGHNPLDVVFHELGHYIDNQAYSAEVTPNSISTLPKYQLGYTLNSELRDRVNKYVDTVQKNGINENDIRIVAGQERYGSIVIKRTKSGKISLPTAKQIGVMNFISDFKAKISQSGYIKYGDVSDMIQAASGGKVKFGYGHDGNYYSRQGTQEREFFAEMTSAVINNPASLSAIKEMFPESAKIYFQMVDDIVKGEN